jgi:hypothetical protein
MHPALEQVDVDRVIEAVNHACAVASALSRGPAPGGL